MANPWKIQAFNSAQYDSYAGPSHRNQMESLGQPNPLAAKDEPEGGHGFSNSSSFHWSKFLQLSVMSHHPEGKDGMLITAHTCG